MRGLVSLTLPAASGPWRVGCTDIMGGFGTEGTFFRLFYPCSPSPAQQQNTLWSPRPEYIAGLLAIRGWEGKVARFGASVILGSPQISVTWNGNFISGNSRRPLVIYSHGLGSCRTIYTSLCMDLASYGFLVAAVEHRDGSACATYHFSEVSSGEAGIPPKEVWIPYKKLEPGMKEFYLRNYQVHQRASECFTAVKNLQDIDVGRTVTNMYSDFNLDVLKDKIDFSSVAVMGHSFGGATALLSLAKYDIFRCAVVLDPWMFPLEDTCYPNIQKPILSINTENFQTNQSVQKIKRLNSLGAELKYLTVLGCVHQSQTDFAFLTGYLANKIAGPLGTMDPHQCLKIMVNSSLDFLHKHLDLGGDVPKLEDLSEAIQAQIIPGFPILHSSKL
ncbi:platelet-activating factor acetylhydrolase 2, cytoplasmic-like [Pseudophryne corroboree]|uniref:platelet-activating factor acetylhydrolase 2, cytoplasmic-like n=1 Tax=Pseudophryne corroboree TaxID=495146 RepID=UPI003081AD14